MKLTSLLLSLATLSVYGKTIKVAVVDTGLESQFMIGGQNGLCMKGHSDFTGTGLNDSVKHGTNVSGIIHNYAKGLDYCQYIVKYCCGPKGVADGNMKSFLKALEYVNTLDVDIVNLSVYGTTYNRDEYLVLQKLLNKGVTIIVAAGNDGKEISNKAINCINRHSCPYTLSFPAMHDPRLIVVGAHELDKNIKAPLSNFGDLIDAWESLSGEGWGYTMNGTSQAAAHYTGKYVRRLATGN